MFEGSAAVADNALLSYLDSTVAFDRPVIRGPARLSLVSNMAVVNAVFRPSDEFRCPAGDIPCLSQTTVVDQNPSKPMSGEVTSQFDETCFQLKIVIGVPSTGEFIVRSFLSRSRANTLLASHVRFGPSCLKAMTTLIAPPC